METTQNANPLKPYLDKFKAMAKTQQLVIVGAVVVLVALFTPAITASYLGTSSSTNFFGWGDLSGILAIGILGGAAAAAYYAYLKDFKMVMYAVGVSAVLTIITFLMVMGQVNSVKTSLGDYGMYAAALKTGVSYGFGWFLLVAGEAAMVAGYVMDMQAKKPTAK